MHENYYEQQFKMLEAAMEKILQVKNFFLIKSTWFAIYRSFLYAQRVQWMWSGLNFFSLL